MICAFKALDFKLRNANLSVIASEARQSRRFFHEIVSLRDISRRDDFVADSLPTGRQARNDRCLKFSNLKKLTVSQARDMIKLN